MSYLQRHKFWLIIALAVVFLVLATRVRRTPLPPKPATDDAFAENSVPSATDVARDGGTLEMKSEPLAPVVMHDAAAEMSNMLANPERNPEERIQAVREVLYLFRQGFGDNPPGHNEMVVSALIGENNKRTALLPKDSPAIKDGALVDAWGTPYWFHALSAKQMEIRSAGPDKELFTQDDLVVE